MRLARSTGIAKPMPWRAADDRGRDADHVPLHVDDGPSGVAGIDRRVDLEEVVVDALVLAGDAPPEGREDAGRDRVGEAERISDRDDGLADQEIRGGAHLDRRAAPCPASATRRTARSLSASDPIDLAGQLLPRLRRRDDPRGAGDDVVVGEDDPLRVDDHPGAERLGRARVHPEEERVEHGAAAADGLFRRDVDDGGSDLVHNLDDLASARGEGGGKKGSRDTRDRTRNRGEAAVWFSHGQKNRTGDQAIPSGVSAGTAPSPSPSRREREKKSPAGAGLLKHEPRIHLPLTSIVSFFGPFP